MSPQSDRDAGFCSGSSELGDDRSDSPHSQIDTSEDSIDVKLPIVLTTKNKRKSSEPVKVIDSDLGPLKKRIRYTSQQAESESSSSSSSSSSNKPTPTPFRPWTVEGPERTKAPPPQLPVIVSPRPVISSPADMFVRHPGVTTLHRAYSPIQDEPLALVKKKTDPEEQRPKPSTPPTPIKVTEKPSIKVKSTNSLRPSAATTPTKTGQRNYKNMTRERRIEANARERSRVHTISAAYETLRKCIPSYSSSQKLSKLAVLRIACAYILALSRMAGDDLSADGSQPDVQDCIEAVSRILQAEGKVKKEGEEDDDDDDE